jgi:hypothetical protein
MKTNIHFSSYLAYFVLEWKIFQKKIVDKYKTRFVFNNFSRKSCRLWGNVEKILYSQTGNRWQYSTAHALGMLETKATDTHSEYVIFIGFPRPQYLRKHASILLFSTLSSGIWKT